MNLYDIVKFPHRVNDDGDHFCTRAKVDIGTICNFKCKFCYYDQRRFIKPLQEIKDTVVKLHELGMTSFDLSGGEPTVHPHFLDIIEFCKNYGKVSCLSNGWRFSHKDFCRKAYNSGLREVMLSYHGIEHEQITGVKDSERRIIAAAKNLRELGIDLRFNCTVCKENYKSLREYCDKIIPLDPFEVNFIIENPWYKDFNLDARYFDIFECGKILDEVCVMLKEKGILVNVRYIPFCAMQHKEFIVNYYQHLYDIYDWNMLYLKNNLDLQPDEVFRTCVNEVRRNRKHYSKNKCGKCKLNHICDGVKDLNTPRPETVGEGSPILDVLYYRHGWFKRGTF